MEQQEQEKTRSINSNTTITSKKKIKKTKDKVYYKPYKQSCMIWETTGNCPRGNDCPFEHN